VTIGGEQQTIVLRIERPADPDLADFYLVMFDRLREPDEAGEQAAASASSTEELETELDLTRHRMQMLIEEYESSREEMQASNEELQSSNEELRSTMEELETSREELQSMNEELATVNQENRHRVEELSQLSSDLQNLMASTEIATLFLDRQLRIVRFTPQVGELFNIRATDRGRPLVDFRSNIGYPQLQDDARRVLERLTPIEREVQGARGRWYLLRVLPYRGSHDRIEGVVITLLDISERKKAQESLRQSEERLAQEVRTLEMLHELATRLIASTDLRAAHSDLLEAGAGLMGAQAGLMRLLEEGELRVVAQRGLSAEFLERTRALSAGRNTPGTSALESKHTIIIEDVKGAGRLPDYRKIAEAAGHMALVSAPLISRGGEPLGAITLHFQQPRTFAERDLRALDLFARQAADFVDGWRSAQAQRRSEQRFGQLVAQVKDYAIFSTDVAGRAVTWNEGVGQVLGYTEPEFLGLDVRRLFTPEDVEAGVPERELEQAAREGSAGNDRWMMRKDGRRFFADGVTSPIRDGEGQITGFTKVMRDHTRLKQAEEALSQSEQRLRLATEATGFGSYDLDCATGRAHCSDQLRRIMGASDAHPVQAREALAALLHPDDRARVLAELDRITGPEAPESHTIEFRIVRRGGSIRWVRATGRAIREEGAGPAPAPTRRARIARIVGTVLDITEDKAHHEQMRLVMAELNHRVKNTLAVVEAVAEQTIRHSADAQEFIAAFSARLQALSAAHNLLTQSEWKGAMLEDVVRLEVASRTGAPQRLKVSGPPVLLRPNTAMALHMVIHELGTNAVKYGALSAPAGALEVVWRLTGAGEPGGEALLIEWTERGGPPVSGPGPAGFGARLLQHTITQQLNGEVDLTWRPEGLRCRIRIPWTGDIGACEG
jgi:two-component system, chemotaxis family, CheB/CheR fusion protein